MMIGKDAFRQVLLVISFIGITTSIFWEVVFPETAIPSDKSCPVGKSVLTMELERLPDIQSKYDCRTTEERDGLCQDCVVINSAVYKSSFLRNHLSLEQMSLEEFAQALSGHSTKHVSQHAVKAAEDLLKRKISCA